MKHELIEQHDELESKIEEALVDKIQQSNLMSPHYSSKAIKVNIFNYKWLSIINSQLTFLDSQGYQYSLYADATMLDLIELL